MTYMPLPKMNVNSTWNRISGNGDPYGTLGT